MMVEIITHLEKLDYEILSIKKQLEHIKAKITSNQGERYDKE